MKYETFKEQVKAQTQAKFPNYEVKEDITYKVNVAKDTLCVYPKDVKEMMSPNIYLDDLYQDFQMGEPFEAIIDSIQFMINRYVRKTDFNCTDLKEKPVIWELISKEKNQTLLQNVVHTEFLDLACVYRYVLKQDKEQTHSMLITNSLLQELGISKEAIHQKAKENIEQQESVQIMRLSEYLYVATNKRKMGGASVILFPKTLKILEEKIGGAFYLLPSSIHEVLAVPKKYMEPIQLLLMLKEGNENFISEKEYLSSSIYLYEKGLFSIVGKY